MNDTVKGITPEGDREHIISLYGHVKGVEREIEIIKTNHRRKSYSPSGDCPATCERSLW